MAVSKSWYRSAVATFNDRTKNCELLLDFLDRESVELKLEDRRRVLSIGTANGNVDVPLLQSHLPQLVSYIAVEPDQYQANILQNRLNRELTKPDIKIDIITKTVESWRGPDEPVDLILLSNVLQYVSDRDSLYQKIPGWLAPGGTMVIVHHDADSIFATVGERFGVSYDLYHDEMVHQDLVTNGFRNLKRKSFLTELDIQDRNKDIMNFLLHRDANKAEISALDIFLRSVMPTGVIKLGVTVIWWTKP